MGINKIPLQYTENYKRLSSESGHAEEKVLLFKEIYAFSGEVDINDLYLIWTNLFAKDPLPIAWIPGKEELETSNLSALVEKVGVSSYNELHQWSIKERALFWKFAIEQLDVKFSKGYESILAGNAENSIWLEEAMMNIVESCFHENDEAIAILEGNEKEKVRRVTYGELKKQADRVTHGLKLLGLTAGDTVVIYMPLTIESIASYLGIIKGGFVVVSVADSFSSMELKKRIESTKAKVIITCDGYYYGGKRIDILKKVHEAEAPIAIVADYTKHSKIRTGDLSFKSLLKDPYPNYYYTIPETTTNILFSSGTTKEPKAIPWSHSTPIKCATDGYYHLNIKEKDIVCWTTGMGWMMAPWLIYASLINKATIAIFTGAASSEQFGRFVEEEKINVLGTIPSVVKAWKLNNFHLKFKWPSVKVFSSTGEPSNQEDYFYLMSLAGFRAPVIEYCGGTEIGGGYITGSVLQPVSPGTFTTPALGIDFYLLTSSEKEAINEPGEVFLIPPSLGLTQKLLNRDHHSEYFEGVPAGPKGEVLRKHGDAFEKIHFMDTTFYKSVGRIDDAMNLGGIKISAVEIEEVLHHHTNVKEAAAISVPDKSGGPESLVVFIDVLEESDLDVLKKELQNLVTTELNPLFKIYKLIRREKLPRTASNKLMRRELRKEYMDMYG